MKACRAKICQLQQNDDSLKEILQKNEESGNDFYGYYIHENGLLMK